MNYHRNHHHDLDNLNNSLCVKYAAIRHPNSEEYKPRTCCGGGGGGRAELMTPTPWSGCPGLTLRTAVILRHIGKRCSRAVHTGHARLSTAGHVLS
ncbi:hypothetical protein E2C01_002122 [Portunus trituberculatus]|uniref:Uncharacterized protein n=1 Tax=Portunus trituberculatus TaxID=210409 RepID=A0A5B7CK51_PORTR|nr:hypothetical protein [Portunus trituberculatus]